MIMQVRVVLLTVLDMLLILLDLGLGFPTGKGITLLKYSTIENSMLELFCHVISFDFFISWKI